MAQQPSDSASDSYDWSYSRRRGSESNETTLNSRKIALANYFRLKESLLDEKFAWKIYRYAGSGIGAHHGVVFQLLNIKNISFSSELMVDEVSVYPVIRIPGEVDNTDFSKKDLFDPEIIENHSINDIFDKAFECIESWREYSLLFYNCRHYATRLKILLNNYKLQEPITPDKQCKIDQGWNLVHTATFGIATYFLLNSTDKFAKSIGLITLPFMFYKRTQSLFDIINLCGQNYYQKDGNTLPKVSGYISAISGALYASNQVINYFEEELKMKQSVNNLCGEFGFKRDYFNICNIISWVGYTPIWFSAFNYYYGQESNNKHRKFYIEELINNLLVIVVDFLETKQK